MKTYLATLAQAILAGSPKGVSKVRFAKLIYLLHKSLVQSGKERPDRLEFQRLPLGPVPVGFFQLAKTLAATTSVFRPRATAYLMMPRFTD